MYKHHRAAHGDNVQMQTSATQTGNGNPQPVAHTFGSTPSGYEVEVLSGHNGSGAAGIQVPTVTRGALTSASATVTVTAGATYVVHFFL